ncbi:MAG TPA: TonB-dependent receptor [Acidobacteriaceae bacterium]|nr:TonB-dependent receptor [Acidobacteriaceae bacterium]
MTRQQRRALERDQQKLARRQHKEATQHESRAPLSGGRAKALSRNWIAAGTIAAYAAFGSSHSAFAASMADPSNSGTPVATLPLKRFDIPAGPLDAALDQFRQTAGIALRIDIAQATLAGFQTHGVKGLYRPEEAIRILLDGTGLESQVLPPQPGDTLTTIAIGLQHHETVNVTTNLPDTVAMTKFTQPLVDTPQSVVAVPQFVLHDEQNTTLRDALRNVPGISLAAGEFGAQGDNLTIRGFSARNDIFLDGIRDFGSYYRDSFDYEQVEVLEGPSGVQFGRGSTGGVINQESKLPQEQPFIAVQTQFGTDATRRLAADINQPLADLASGAAFRANIVATEGGVAGRPYAANRHYGIAPSLSFGMDSPTRETISYFHLTENDTPDYGLPWLINKPAPADRHAYFGFPDSNYLRANVDILTGRFDHDFSPLVTLHSIGRWANYARDAQITEPQICSNSNVAVPVGGYVSSLPSVAGGKAPCTYTPTTPADQIAVNRNELQVRSVEGELWDQTDLTARFNLLGIRNDLDAGIEGGRETSSPVRTSYTVSGSNTVPAANLAHPDAGDAVFSGTGYISSITHTKSDSVGIFFLDTIHLSRLFQLSGGVRWDWFDTHYNLYAPPTSIAGASLSSPVAPISQIVHQPTYRAAFVYKPTPHGSVYFDWGTSFNPSAESLSLSVATSVLPPEENESYEAGAKYSLLHDRLMLDGAWFRTLQLNARETSPTDSSLIVLSGNQLVRGVQASAVGHLPDSTDIVLGYAWMHSEVTASQFFPTSIGYPLANVPRQTFNAFLSRRLFARLKAGLGGNYVGARTASSTAPFVPLTFGPLTTYTTPTGSQAQGYPVLSVGMRQVPGYWVFNAMLSRPVTDRIELQANVYNLLNRFYIDQPHPSHLIPGAGLSALIGANFRF